MVYIYQILVRISIVELHTYIYVSLLKIKRILLS